MDIVKDAKILQHGGKTHLPVDVKRTVWRNSAWERGGPIYPARPFKQKNGRMPIIPFRVLDAPALRDDFYCSLLAYSHTRHGLAVGLGPHVYIWSESRTSQSVPLPASPTGFTSHVTSLSFSSTEGGSAILAVGRADGHVVLWSPSDNKPRIVKEHPTPVSYVSFRPNIVRRQSVRERAATVATEELLIGDELGNVQLFSIEWPSQPQRDLFAWHGAMTKLAHIKCHDQQICGIAWSVSGEYFATGANDNQLVLFDRRRLLLPFHPHSNPPTVAHIKPGQQMHTLTLNAAVKAIAFAPWQPSLLAAGGGSNDRCIHFFHAVSGATLATLDCHAQVTSLVWSSGNVRREIAATFGFAQPEHPYRVAVFAWPSCRRVLAIPWWNEERALYAIPYPGGPVEKPKSSSDGGAGAGAGAKGKGGKGLKDGMKTTVIMMKKKKATMVMKKMKKKKNGGEEGCLVIATSDASIKFHEIWSNNEYGTQGSGGAGKVLRGAFGGSQILEDVCSPEMELAEAIR